MSKRGTARVNFVDSEPSQTTPFLHLEVLRIKYDHVSAPEVFAVASGDDNIKGYSFSVDWWSFGVCLFEILNKGRVGAMFIHL